MGKFILKGDVSRVSYFELANDFKTLAKWQLHYLQCLVIPNARCFVISQTIFLFGLIKVLK